MWLSENSNMQRFKRCHSMLGTKRDQPSLWSNTNAEFSCGIVGAGGRLVGRRDLPCTSSLGREFPGSSQLTNRKRELEPRRGVSCRKSCSRQARWGSVGLPKCNLASSVMVSPQRPEPWWPSPSLASSTKPSHRVLSKPLQQS